MFQLPSAGEGICTDLDFYYLISSDPFAKEIEKTVVYSHFFSSREEKMIKKITSGSFTSRSSAATIASF